MARVRLAGLATFIVLALAPLTAHASFHLWEIKEVYSNASGTVQFIELFCPAGGQDFLASQTIVVNDGTNHTFTFPTSLSGDTTNKSLLIATPGFAKLNGGVAPDYTLPCGAFFNPSATTITISFAGTNDVESFSGSSLPKDGINSLTDTTASGSGTATFTSGTNSPTNFAGTSGSVTLTSGQLNGTADVICNDGLYCNGAETCSNSACTGTSPCPQQCIEATHACVECITATDCDDKDPCTDDTCDGSNMCHHAPATGAQCDNNSIYCDGVGICSAGVCAGIAPPCDPMSTICDEMTRTCTPGNALRDAGTNNDNGGGGGCCQASTSTATFSGPALVLALGLLLGRRRRTRGSSAAARTR